MSLFGDWSGAAYLKVMIRFSALDDRPLAEFVVHKNQFVVGQLSVRRGRRGGGGRATVSKFAMDECMGARIGACTATKRASRTCRGIEVVLGA